MGNTQNKKEKLYTDVQIISPQNGFYMYYPPPRVNLFDTSGRIQCCQKSHPFHRKWLNEGFAGDIANQRRIPNPSRWINIGYIKKPFKTMNDRSYLLQASVVIPNKKYRYRVYGPYGEFHKVYETKKIVNNELIQVNTLKDYPSTWQVKIRDNNWTSLFTYL